MKTLGSTVKWMKAWCKSRDIQLISSEKVVVPHAVYDRDNNRKLIYMPPLTSLNFDEWQREGYHEASHLAPQNLWHYDVLEVLSKEKGVALHSIANCLIDNLAERVDFHEYRGRAELLSATRAALIPKLWKVMEQDKNNPVHSLQTGLLKWDILNREKWMINFVAPTAHKPVPHADLYFEKTKEINLDRVMDKIAQSENIPYNITALSELVLLIDSWIHSENGNQQQQRGGSNGNDSQNGDEKETKPSQETASSGEEDDSESGEGAGRGNSDGNDGESSKDNDQKEGSSSDSGGGEESQSNTADKGDGASDTDNPAKQAATPAEQPPSYTKSSAGSNFIPQEYGAGITEPQYTKEELEAMSTYTQDIERSIEEDVKQNVGEVVEALKNKYEKTKGFYLPCREQQYIRISNNGRYRANRAEYILRKNKQSTLDKQVRKHLQLRSTGRTVHGVKRGKLSGKNLHRLYTNNGSLKTQPAVFKRREHGKVKTDSAVSLLIDCSGSMGSVSNAMKYTLAAASALSLATVLNGLRIKHEVLGFTHSPGIHTVYLFKEFPEKPLSDEELAKRLSSYRVQQDHNADGESLQYTAERLIRMPERNKVLIVLSDGLPNGYWRGDGHRYLKEVVNDIENHSPIHLAAIGIDSTAVAKYYSNYQVIRKMEELAGAVLSTLSVNLLTP